MRIAIVGGGASGLAAAWLLDPAHEVHLYERASTLGGHVRTLGGNVACPALPPGLRLDAGVIEFDRVDFPAFHAWMAALGVAVESLPDAGSTNLFLADGRHFHSPGALAVEHPHLVERITEGAHLLPLLLRLRRFRHRTAAADAAGPGEIERFLSDDEFSVWVRSLLMYAYSVHYDEVRHLSAALAVPMLRAFLEVNDWTHVPGGVSTYVDAVARSLRGPVHLDARIAAIRRRPAGEEGAGGGPGGGVTLHHEDGGVEPFDAVVLAVPPHRVLPLLPDADAREHAWFGAHEGGPVETVVHHDAGPYSRRGVHAPTEFDLFELADGTHGYNAFLNRLAGLPADHPERWGLAFDLDAELDPACVVHRQTHDVARYTARALAHRDDLLAANGHRATWHVGAWLGDGLHEGAVRSALAVAARLGGRTFPGYAPATPGSARP